MSDILFSSTRVSLSSSQILSLGSTPVEIVPAPGAGKAIIPVSGKLLYKFGTVAYDLSNSANYPTLFLRPGPGGPENFSMFFYILGATVFGVEDEWGLNSSKSCMIPETGTDVLSGYVGIPFDKLNNSNLVAQTVDMNTGAASTAFNPTTGDGTLDILLDYKIITL